MAKNKGHQALQEYCQAMQMIVSCVANDVCFTYPNSFGRLALNWSKGAVRLHCTNGKNIFVDIGQEIDDPGQSESERVSTKRYIYSVLDEEGMDLIGFHYHPDLDDEPVLYPHIHVYADADKRFAFFNLHKKHIPSGRVALEDIIEWLIEELDVNPMRDDWKSILAKSR